jgi:hypothetical protein
MFNRLTNLGDANPSPCAANAGSRSTVEASDMRTQFGTGTRGAFWSSSSIRGRHLASIEETCWFVAIGLSLTVLFCALGYSESLAQALAISG